MSPFKIRTLFVRLTNVETAIYIVTTFLSDHQSNGYQHYCYVMIDNTAKIDSVNDLIMVAYLNVIHVFFICAIDKIYICATLAIKSSLETPEHKSHASTHYALRRLTISIHADMVTSWETWIYSSPVPLKFDRSLDALPLSD